MLCNQKEAYQREKIKLKFCKKKSFKKKLGNKKLYIWDHIHNASFSL